MRCSRILLVLLVLVVTAASSGAQRNARRVLLLYSYEREFAVHHAFATMFRPELSKASADPVSFIEVALQPVRTSQRDRDESIVTEFASGFGGQRFDLVVSIGGPAAAFAHKHRQELFPATPMLLAAVDRRFVENGSFGASETAVAVEHDPPQMIENILQLLPDTQTVFVVIGASKLEQFWLDEVKRGVRHFEDRVRFVWMNELSFAEMLRRCGALPPHSAIFYGVLALDATGVAHVEEQTVRELHAAANAPIFGLHSTQLGRGIVGGPLLSIEDLSRTTAAVALRILAGESPASITTPTLLPGTPTFDDRELRRWKIGEERLRPGSLVRFREPTTWQRNQRQIVAGATIAGVQLLVVIALGARLLRRRRSERLLRASEEHLRLQSSGLASLSRRLIQTQEIERLAIGKKLHDDLGQRLMVLTLQLHRFAETPPDGADVMRARLKRLHDEIAHLSRDTAAISDELCSSRLILLGLATTAKLVCSELSAAHGVAIHFRHEGMPPALSHDVAFALFRVLEEALSNAVKHSGVRQISVSLRAGGDEVQLEIADEGVGFDPETAFTSGAVGLIGMRERLSLVNGSCEIASRPGGGTRILARVPVNPATGSGS